MAGLAIGSWPRSSSGAPARLLQPCAPPVHACPARNHTDLAHAAPQPPPQAAAREERNLAKKEPKQKAGKVPKARGVHKKPSKSAAKGNKKK